MRETLAEMGSAGAEPGAEEDVPGSNATVESAEIEARNVAAESEESCDAGPELILLQWNWCCRAIERFHHHVTMTSNEMCSPRETESSWKPVSSSCSTWRW
jgi:hypothetical protein